MATPIVKITSNQYTSPITLSIGTPFITNYMSDVLSIQLSNTSGTLSQWTLTIVGWDDSSTVGSFSLSQASSPTGVASLYLPPVACSCIIESQINNDPNQKYRFKVSQQLSDKSLLCFNEVYESSASTGWVSQVNQYNKPFKTRPIDLHTNPGLVNWWKCEQYTGTSTLVLADTVGGADLQLNPVTSNTIKNIVYTKPYQTGVSVRTFSGWQPVFKANTSTHPSTMSISLTMKYKKKPSSNPHYIAGQKVAGTTGDNCFFIVANAAANPGFYSITYYNVSGVEVFIHTDCPVVENEIHNLVVTINATFGGSGNRYLSFYCNGTQWVTDELLVNPAACTNGYMLLTGMCPDIISVDYYDFRHYDRVLLPNQLQTLALSIF